MIREGIQKIINHETLSFDESYLLMNEIMSGQSTPTLNSSFLTALSCRKNIPETPDEISGCARAMRSQALELHLCDGLLEIVGTGGDHKGTFNISTAAAIICAAAGAKVAKHGNRAATSNCGTADCLEALHVNINQSPGLCKKLIDECGICFLFAQKYHSSMKHVASIRRELGFRTIFNLLGPLTNPALPDYQLLGVYDFSLIEPMALALMKLGLKRGMVVCAQDGMDEISLCSKTDACFFDHGELTHIVIDPANYGFEYCKESDLKGSTPQENAKTMIQILNNEDSFLRDAAILNAGFALFICNQAENPEKGIEIAKKAIESKAAINTLNQLIRLSNEKNGLENNDFENDDLQNEPSGRQI